MQFGKATTPEALAEVDFRLPSAAPSAGVLPGQPAASFLLRMGLPRWGEKAFVGQLYPPKTPQKRFLEAYCQQLTAAEVNATAYQLLKPERAASWRTAAEVGQQGFQFCPKLPQSITHRKALPADERLLVYAEAVQVLGEYHGVSLMQLPDHFSPANRGVLYRFLEAVPPELPLAIELRHTNWYTDQAACEELTDSLTHYGHTWVVTDTPMRREMLNARLTIPTLMVRYAAVGNPYDAIRLKAWADRLVGWKAQGLANVYWFVHAPDGAYLPALIHAHSAFEAAGLPVPPRPTDYTSVSSLFD